MLKSVSRSSPGFAFLLFALAWCTSRAFAFVEALLLLIFKSSNLFLLPLLCLAFASALPLPGCFRISSWQVASSVSTTSAQAEPKAPSSRKRQSLRQLPMAH